MSDSTCNSEAAGRGHRARFSATLTGAAPRGLKRAARFGRGACGTGLRYALLLAATAVFLLGVAAPLNAQPGAYGADAAAVVADASGPAAPMSRRAYASVWARTLLWGLVLIVILVASTIAVIRFSRRYRAYLLKHGHAPTADADVWSMHRLPENGDSNGGDGDGGGNGGGNGE